MKVIVTGATGAAGQAIVQQCFQDERISKVIILTRRAVAMDVESHPKAQVVMHQDFSHYPHALMRGLEGAEACLWAIRGKASQTNDEKELCRKVNVDYVLAAANAMLRHLAGKTPNGRKFRFVFCSGRFAEPSPSRALIFQGEMRRIKGEVENALLELADAHKEKLDVWILRPGVFKYPEGAVARKLIGRFYSAITTGQLARAMVTVGREGWRDRIIENETLLRI